MSLATLANPTPVSFAARLFIWLGYLSPLVFGVLVYLALWQGWEIKVLWIHESIMFQTTCIMLLYLVIQGGFLIARKQTDITGAVLDFLVSLLPGGIVLWFWAVTTVPSSTYQWDFGRLVLIVCIWDIVSGLIMTAKLGMRSVGVEQ